MFQDLYIFLHDKSLKVLKRLKTVKRLQNNYAVISYNLQIQNIFVMARTARARKVVQIAENCQKWPKKGSF